MDASRSDAIDALLAAVAQETFAALGDGRVVIDAVADSLAHRVLRSRIDGLDAPHDFLAAAAELAIGPPVASPQARLVSWTLEAP